MPPCHVGTTAKPCEVKMIILLTKKQNLITGLLLGGAQQENGGKKKKTFPAFVILSSSVYTTGLTGFLTVGYKKDSLSPPSYSTITFGCMLYCRAFHQTGADAEISRGLICESYRITFVCNLCVSPFVSPQADLPIFVRAHVNIYNNSSQIPLV